ncbi:hypothetical protein PFICI_06852 [Pestalotiopsis fici W106-1]|uniref:O-methyltransferase n=1 Tax=Pestalotiopsis fici (strain W106-1 / CGMCC3.15140) TaxID=1229662 RepID=W3X723_PESFW|nr:uncharacterized protein PFICI_06852 [Pestalotiopsis fici W106-1]ETS81850.1 hypothetical protein PFICI_06852 [Pestalotiopsis fici W106-1]
MKDAKPILYSNDAVAEAVTTYSEAHSLDLPKWLIDYHADVCRNNTNSNLMISTYQARSLVWLARLIDAKRVLEIGVYLGFSTMTWSHAVGPSGTVTGLEFNPEFAQRAEAAFASNSLSNITLKVGDALAALPALETPGGEPYDVVFVDAQKSGYVAYLQTVLDRSPAGAPAAQRLLRKGGLLIGDNALRRGLVADDSAANPHRPTEPGAAEGEEYKGQHDDVGKMREFNDAVKANPRLEPFLLPLWDGLVLARLVD